jgi:hypothetical protein
LAATTRKKKRSTKPRESRKRGPSKAELQRRARKGAETKRRKAREAEERHRRHVEAGKRGYQTRLQKERAREALAELRRAVRKKSPRIAPLRESWHREKNKLERVIDDYDRYMAILEELSDDEAPDWDIAYGSTESAA